MKSQIIKSNLLLFLTAAIWGFAFVAQRVGMEYVGPFTYNGVRFALGSLSLVPLLLYFNRNSPKKETAGQETKNVIRASFIAGLVLFAGASLQQTGIVYTSAGKAAFITSLYIILVPIFGIFLKHHINANTWIGAAVSIVGLYLLSVTEQLSIEKGDLLELIGSFFWAAHILIIDHFSRKVDILKLSCFQFLTCSALSIVSALFFESISVNGVLQAAVPILYGGICSVGIAYTLQVVGQKNAKPSHAAIILSMENVFAAVGGLILLNETMDLRGTLGCVLMFTGLLLSQLTFKKANL